MRSAAPITMKLKVELQGLINVCSPLLTEVALSIKSKCTLVTTALICTTTLSVIFIFK